MTNLPIDIVILPPEDIMDLAIKLNQEGAKQGLAKGPLARDDFFPHISLALGTIDEKDLVVVNKIVEEICQDFFPLDIELFDKFTKVKEDGTKNITFGVKKDEDLQRLHELLMTKLQPHFIHQATVEDLYKKEGEEVKEPGHVNKFSEHCFDNYYPHLTLRVQETEFNDFPITFIGTNIAVCHIGTETTCRKIFFQLDLV